MSLTFIALTCLFIYLCLTVLFFSENDFVNSVVIVSVSINDGNFLSNLLLHVLSSVVVTIS